MFEVPKPKEARACCRCGEKYSPNSPNQKYCSKCRDAARMERSRKYMREYTDANREIIREKQRIRYRERYVPLPEHDYKDCAVCGAPFVPYHVNWSLYCSEMCRRAAENEHQRRRRARKREAAT